MKRDGYTLMDILVVIAIIGILATLFFANHRTIPENPEATASVINYCEINGFTAIKIIKWEIASNSKDDDLCYYISAVDSNDRYVEFTVYWSQSQGSVIRN